VTVGLQIGSPGVYFTPVRPSAEPQTVHLDETGFVGIASRGPVDQPIKVTSWSDFVRWFGGLPRPEHGEPPTQLAYSVQTYFAQRGRTAWIVRVGPADSVCATAGFAAVGRDSLRMEAANKGAWGNLLSITLDFTAGTEFVADVIKGDGGTRFVVPPGVDIARNSLLRIDGVMAWLTALVTDHIDHRRRTVGVLDRRLPAAPGARIGAAVITGSLTVIDRDVAVGRTERFVDLGLHPDHPRFVPRVIQQASEVKPWYFERDGRDSPSLEVSALVTVPQLWTEPVLPDDRLRPLEFRLMDNQPGLDRWSAIDRTSFFDDGPAESDPLDEQPHRGVDAIGRVEDIGLLCVPDLAWRGTPPQPQVFDDRRMRSAEFVRCCAVQSPAIAASPVADDDVWLDPTDSSERDEIIARQRRVLDVADLRRRFVFLLDVPFRLPTREIASWRAYFDSSYAAAYHPWLRVTVSGLKSRGQFVPPSAFAAGIIANREIRLGIHRGPANELATAAVDSSSLVNEVVAAKLFRLAVNVFRPERDGYRLQSARTLSSDPLVRQLSVRRLMTMITLTLQRIGDQLVFEPDTPQLRSVLAQTIGSVLGEFHRRGAFAGAREADSFFVTCDDRLNTPQSIALGQLVAEVGVAPAEPLEFIMVRIVQTADGVEVSGGG
jgi:hypothetical protein